MGMKEKDCARMKKSDVFVRLFVTVLELYKECNSIDKLIMILIWQNIYYIFATVLELL